MPLPAPDLDDRRFQRLVDDAKRRVAQDCPEWTDHNVSDPGVTLIEAFAHMVDELSYRLNRVPDRLYVTFLNLLGMRLHGPAAAGVDLVMWLSAPQPEPVVVPIATEAATRRTEDDEAVVFATTRLLTVPPRRLTHVMSGSYDGQLAPLDAGLREGQLVAEADMVPWNGVNAFSDPPRPDDTLMLALDDAAPWCAVALRFECDVQGVGVDPLFPPLVWEAWDGSAWAPCELERDETGGLNMAGDVIVHVPGSHAASNFGGLYGGWLRCRVVPVEEGVSFYTKPPKVRSVSAFTVGGTVSAVHAETVRDDILGLSEGVPGQCFPVGRRPIVADGPRLTVDVAAGSGWEPWQEIDSFAGCSEADRVVVVDRATGEVHFPPAVRMADGSLRGYGAVPPKGAPLRVPVYQTGGGPQGNVAAGTITVLRTTVPGVDRVENKRAAHGGIAGETIDQAKIRGPLELRTRDRAVTIEDYEQLARRAAPGIARVRCVPATGTEEAGVVRVLVVPSGASNAHGQRRFEDLVPSDAVLAAVAEQLDERRAVGARVLVEPPYYRGVKVVAHLVARPRVSPAALKEAGLGALYRYFDPLTGGPDGCGWPFGRPVQAGEVYAVLQRLAGTERVDEVKLLAVDQRSGERGDPVQRIELGRHELVFSIDHRVRVTAEA